MRAENDLECMFSDIAPVLQEIAARRNLLIEKYPHEQTIWCLCFEHPSGGQAKIEVHRNDPDTVLVTGNRWRDDYEAAVRYLRWGDIQRFAPDETLGEHIEAALDTVLNWSEDEWSKKVGGYEPFWHRYSKAEFLQLTSRWPKPKLRSAQQGHAGDAQNARA